MANSRSGAKTPPLEIPIVEEEAIDFDSPVTAQVKNPDQDDRNVTIPDELSILTIRESVVYPMLIAPLSVARESGVTLVDDTVANGTRIIGLVAQKRPQDESPGFDDIFEVGCAVIIRTMVKTPGATRLIVQGLQRFRIVEQLSTSPYLKAKVQLIEDLPVQEEEKEEIEALRRSIGALFEEVVRLTPNLQEDLKSLPQAVSDVNVMTDLVAAHTELSVEDKQAILETNDLKERMRRLLEMLNHEVRILELTTKVQSQVSAELSKSQRDYFLREQLKTIQRELGDVDDSDENLQDLLTRINDADMSAEAYKEAKREFDRLRRMNPGSPEYTVTRTYIDTIAALPWTESSEDNLDLGHVKSVLDDEHYGLEKIKERIIEFLAVRKVKTDGKIRQPILCFAGPPGVGKTSLGRSIAVSIGRKYVRISLGGMRDEAEIRGHRRTYVGAMPGQIIQGLRRAQANNPVFVLDEIDKLVSDFRGDPASALLEVLDPEQNSTFRDHYLDCAFDLSRVFFVTTANRLDTIPAALRDRMEVIELGGYTEDEKFNIAKQHLIPKQIEEHGLKPSQIGFQDASVLKLIQNYTREAGVRNLEREIGSVTRKATRLFAEGRTKKVTVNSKFLEEALGAPRYLHDEVSERQLEPGTAIGLAYTAVGGEVLFIETAIMPGPRQMTVTGQLGDVMKESVTAAMSYLRSHAEKYKINPEILDKHEIHVHVPAGAVPKDGPSAGITMLTALTSLLTGRPVKQRLAMTGELTLSGQVLPIGGVKEKVLAAQRAGVDTLILPDRNQKDYLEEIPKEIRDLLTVHFVKTADQVLALALTPIPKRTAKAVGSVSSSTAPAKAKRSLKG